MAQRQRPLCAGLVGKIGSLSPGKEADVVLIRTDEINLYPSNNAIGTVVAAADSRNVIGLYPTR